MKNVYWKSIGAVLLFLIMQAVVSAVMLAGRLVMNPGMLKKIAESGFNPSDMASLNTPSLLSLVVIVSGIITCFILWRKKMIRMPEAWDCGSIRWKPALIGVLGVVLGVMATDLASEQLNLPDIIKAEMQGMVGTIWGMLAVGVVGPIVEELVFREGIQGTMLRSGVRPWKAMLFSALLFGLIHVNPAQVPFTFVVGLMLAVIYQVTGNVVVTSLIHILNNSIAVAEINVLGEHADDFSYAEWLGLSPVTVWIPIALLALLCVLLLRLFSRRY